MKSIFYLQHSYEEEDYDITTDIGVFSTLNRAQDMLNKLVSHPKFRDYPDCFYISEYMIDEDHWTEGFFTY